MSLFTNGLSGLYVGSNGLNGSNFNLVSGMVINQDGSYSNIYTNYGNKTTKTTRDNIKYPFNNPYNSSHNNLYNGPHNGPYNLKNNGQTCYGQPFNDQQILVNNQPSQIQIFSNRNLNNETKQKKIITAKEYSEESGVPIEYFLSAH